MRDAVSAAFDDTARNLFLIDFTYRSVYRPFLFFDDPLDYADVDLL